MGKKTKDEELSDREAQERANAALRRALMTPYKPQSEMKLGTKPKKRAAQKMSGKKKSRKK